MEEPANDQPEESGDQSLTCQNCGTTFPFTAQEQRFFHEMGFVTPRYCPACRRKRKKETARSEPWKDFYEVTCDRCGEETTVPFKPVHGRPVYCRSCLNSIQQQDSRAVDDTASVDGVKDAKPDSISGLGLTLHEEAERPYEKLQRSVQTMIAQWVQSDEQG
ncbi:hypothetical protein GF324_01440 [bacterium]|nr:hypothetical protein [bacterium]